MKRPTVWAVFIFCLCALRAASPEEAPVDAVEKLVRIDSELAKSPDEAAKSQLLIEKASILLTQDPSLQGSLEITKILLEAIRLDPYDEESKKLLFITYEKFLKHSTAKQRSGDEKLERRVKEARKVLREFNVNKNFDYLCGPYEVKDFLGRLNRAKIFLSEEDAGKDAIISYSSEYGWFELEGTYSYFELYEIDLDNDGMMEHVVLYADDRTDNTEIKAVYKENNGRIIDEYYKIKREVAKLIETSLHKQYRNVSIKDFRTTEIVFKRTGEAEVFAFRLSPAWQEREKLGDEDTWLSFCWENNSLRLGEQLRPSEGS